MAEMLQDQFCKVFSNPDNPSKLIPPPPSESIPETLDSLVISDEDISRAINELSPDSAAGEDEFPAQLLKSCKASLLEPIKLIWQDSLDNGYIHPTLKSQLICPVFKKGSKALPENYRPISLTSHVTKIFERIIRDKIVSHLESNNLLNDRQHGFRKKRSCLSELVDHFSEVLDNLSRGHDTDSIYLDFAKAFDKVDHEILLKKVHNLGIRVKLYDWIKEFLSERVQKVSVDGIHSEPRNVLSGVPQGTVLGPILFLIYMNDIDKILMYASLRSFADDTRIVKKIETLDDVQLLQTDLENVIKWSSENNMQLHEDKFEFIQHNITTNDKELLNQLPFVQYKQCYKTPDGTLLCPLSEVRDLGVIVTPQISWMPHIRSIVKKATKSASWCLSVFRQRDHHTMLTLYKSLVRSHLEYCCPLWNPHNHMCGIKLLEDVQLSFTETTAGYNDLCYWDLLASLHLMSLQRRRERYIIIYMWKILHNLYPNSIQVNWHHNDRLGIRAILPPMPKHKSKLLVHENSLAVIGPRLWNCIPMECTLAHNLESFKKSLQKYLDLVPDLPPVCNYTTKNSNSLLDWSIDGGRCC